VAKVAINRSCLGSCTTALPWPTCDRYTQTEPGDSGRGNRAGLAAVAAVASLQSLQSPPCSRCSRLPAAAAVAMCPSSEREVRRRNIPVQELDLGRG